MNTPDTKDGIPHVIPFCQRIVQMPQVPSYLLGHSHAHLNFCSKLKSGTGPQEVENVELRFSREACDLNEFRWEEAKAIDSCSKTIAWCLLPQQDNGSSQTVTTCSCWLDKRAGHWEIAEHVWSISIYSCLQPEREKMGSN